MGPNPLFAARRHHDLLDDGADLVSGVVPAAVTFAYMFALAYAASFATYNIAVAPGAG